MADPNASTPSRRGLLQTTAAVVVAAAVGAAPAMSAQSPVSSLATEFRGLVAEVNKAFELGDVVPATPDSLAAEKRYRLLEDQIEAVVGRILEQPARTWDDIKLRGEAAAHISEFGPGVWPEGVGDLPIHERIIDDLIRSVLVVAAAR